MIAKKIINPINLLLIIAIVAVGLFFIALPADASTSIIRSGEGTPCNFDGREAPTLECIMFTLGNIAQLILAVAGGLTLLMFVYGGFLMLASAGAEERVRKGKDALKAALIGLAIILLSGYLVNYGLRQLRVDADYIEEQQPTNSNPE